MPNPFNSSTVIKYFIPLQIARAQIKISDANGQVVKTIALNSKGVGETTIAVGSLPAGNYFYTLWLDGKNTLTKTMVIAK